MGRLNWWRPRSTKGRRSGTSADITAPRKRRPCSSTFWSLPDASPTCNERGGIMRVHTLRRVFLTAGAGALLAGMIALVPAAATSASPGPHYAWTTIKCRVRCTRCRSGSTTLALSAATTACRQPLRNQGFIEQGGHFRTIRRSFSRTLRHAVAWDNDLGVIGGYLPRRQLHSAWIHRHTRRVHRVQRSRCRYDARFGSRHLCLAETWKE